MQFPHLLSQVLSKVLQLSFHWKEDGLLPVGLPTVSPAGLPLTPETTFLFQSWSHLADHQVDPVVRQTVAKNLTADLMSCCGESTAAFQDQTFEEESEIELWQNLIVACLMAGVLEVNLQHDLAVGVNCCQQLTSQDLHSVL